MRFACRDFGSGVIQWWDRGITLFLFVQRELVLGRLRLFTCISKDFAHSSHSKAVVVVDRFIDCRGSTKTIAREYDLQFSDAPIVLENEVSSETGPQLAWCVGVTYIPVSSRT
jgi:hypothetical protein